MKKHGFTLAEVLVTLGIIGVVAALTIPALIQSVSNAKIGPRLQKTKATFETATEMMLTEENSNAITSITKKTDELGNHLQHYMKITPTEKNVSYLDYTGKNGVSQLNSTGVLKYVTDDGTAILINIVTNAPTKTDDSYANIPNNQYIGSLYVDVNGDDNPNRVGRDVFGFNMYNDGTLRPIGAKKAYRSTSSSLKVEWTSVCNADGVNTKHSLGDRVGLYCTGSIFDNGMKVIYQ